MHFFARLGFVLLVVDSGEAVCLLRLLQGSISLGVVDSATCLTGWEDRSRSSVSLTIYSVCFGIVCNFVVGVRVCLGTTIVIVGTIRIFSGLVFLSFELTTLILIVTWFLTMMARWFGLVRVLLWGLLRHSVYWHFVWSFQTIQFQLPFKMRHNLFIRAILQVRLVYSFLQVGRHFGMDKLIDDRLSGNSE